MPDWADLQCLYFTTSELKWSSKQMYFIWSTEHIFCSNFAQINSHRGRKRLIEAIEESSAALIPFTYNQILIPATENVMLIKQPDWFISKKKKIMLQLAFTSYKLY